MRIRWMTVLVILSLAALAGPGVAVLNGGDAGAASESDPGDRGPGWPAAGYEIVALRSYTVGNDKPRTAACPPGKKVLAGGAHADGVRSALTGSFPAADRTGWTAGGAGGDGDVTLSVWAVCADVS